MIEIENLDEFCRGIEDFVGETEREWGRGYKQFIVYTMEALLNASPQYSGFFVSNWRAHVGQGGFSPPADVSHEHVKKLDRVRFRGDQEAMTEPRAQLRGELDRTRAGSILRDEVTFYNPTSYRDLIAANQKANTKSGTFLRAGNWLDPRPVPIGYAEILYPQLFTMAFQ